MTIAHYLSLSLNGLPSLSASVGDFQQPFEIDVELKGVLPDASVTHVNSVRSKLRTLHCGTVSVAFHSTPPHPCPTNAS